MTRRATRETDERARRAILQRVGIRDLNPMQIQAIEAISSGQSVLIQAPTGSGKTEAALLPILGKLLGTDKDGIRLLYVTPLRALNRDMVDRVMRLVAK